jgi:MFS family permease
VHNNITKLYAFSFLQKTLFPMAIITLFWKDQIGLTLTQILLLQSIFSVATVLFEYPSGYLSDRIGTASRSMSHRFWELLAGSLHDRRFFR